ncbi:MAG TPA: ABC transporter ATP-binding protein [Terriglobales bacterium]|nr:ABC transporter ATP-binding protein [Terriglobales bacterium]
MIELQSLKKVFRQKRKEVLAVDNVSFEVGKGVVYGLIGPNGAGKTTLVKLLSTLIIPTSGTAFINGYNILTQDSEVRKSIGLAAGTERSFYYRLSGWQNLWFFGALQKLNSNDLKNRIESLLKRLDIYSEKDKDFMKCSTGEKRKLDLARCLLTDPPVLLLDEPTTSIDPYSAMKIREVIGELKDKGRTIILVTHNLSEAERLCDRVGIMSEGRLVKEGSLANLKTEVPTKRVTIRLEIFPPEEFLQRLKAFGEVKTKPERREVEIMLLDSKKLNELLNLINSSDISLEAIQTRELSLEEIFIKYTHGQGQ